MTKTHQEGPGSPSIGVLIKAGTAPAGGPCDRPSTAIMAGWSETRAPLVYCTLAGIIKEGVQLLADGWRPCPTTNKWLPVTAAPLRAIYNRYPLQQAPARLAQLAAEATACKVPMANTPALQALVSDKWQTQVFLTKAGLPMPEAALSPQDWPTLLQTWQRAYLKPRYGAFGEGIAYLTCDAAQQVSIEGPTPGELQRCDLSELLTTLQAHTNEALDAERWLLQRAIAPPLSGLRGFCIRSLVQQTHGDDRCWRSLARVARCSPDDPVANVARNAEATPLNDLVHPTNAPLPAALLTRLDELDQAIPAALQEALNLPSHAIVELGIDYLVDPQHQPWLLEINGFPQGRLAKLAARAPERFQEIFRQVREQPLETLYAYSDM